MSIITKEDFIAALKQVRDQGWVCCARPGNAGGVGNTLEDLLGIEENNLPIPNAAEWELKTQRANTSSLTTLFHMEPSPRAARLVPQILLPKYGWAHQEAGARHPATERSFRQTIGALGPSNRGFCVKIDRDERKVLISFDASKVHACHEAWLGDVEAAVGLGELDPQPYWGFDDLFHKAGTKLLNCFYVVAQVKKEDGKQCYNYTKIQMLERFSLECFLSAIEKGEVLIDFDARTGHNHGTKFRLKQGYLPDLYTKVTDL
jgi:hypothetical protein